MHRTKWNGSAALAKTMAPWNNSISAQQEELADIEKQVTELEKNGTSEQQQFFLDDIKQAEGGFKQCVIHRVLKVNSRRERV